MITLNITPQERQSGRLSPEHLSRALHALDEDGCVLLPGIVAVEHIDALCEKMLADIRTFEQRTGIDNNFQGVRPPPFHPYLFQDILLNELVIAITHAVIGDGVTNDAYGANTAFPGSGEQAPHADGGQLWPDLERAHPPFALIVNIPLVDVDEDNGATKIWPGTHKDTGTVLKRSEHVPPEKIAAWEKRRPAERLCTRRGDVVLRDNRMWHGGMPNRTDTPRPMLTMIHKVPWWFRGGVEFERGSEEFLRHPVLKTNAVFVDAPIDYLKQGHSRPLLKMAGA